MIGDCCRLEGPATPCRQLHSVDKRRKERKKEIGEGASTDFCSPIGGMVFKWKFFFGGRREGTVQVPSVFLVPFRSSSRLSTHH